VHPLARGSPDAGPVGGRSTWAGVRAAAIFRRPPSARTFTRVFTGTDAEAFNAAVYGWLAAVPASSPAALPPVTRHEREQRRAARAEPGPPGRLDQAAADGKTVRGAVRPDGSQVHLLSVIDVDTGCVRAQRELHAKTNEIPELAPAIAHQAGKSETRAVVGRNQPWMTEAAGARLRSHKGRQRPGQRSHNTKTELSITYSVHKTFQTIDGARSAG
jgi:hypothetical protein